MRKEEPAIPGNAADRRNAAVAGSILVVDDDTAFVKALAIYLEDMGFNVVTATSGLQGVVKSQRQPIEVMLVDANLPDMNGLEVASRIRLLQPWASCILISSDDSPESIRRLSSSGGCVFMAKPLSPKKLVETIHRIKGTLKAPASQVAN